LNVNYDTNAEHLVQLAPEVDRVFARPLALGQVKFLRSPMIGNAPFRRMAWAWTALGFLLLGNAKNTLAKAVNVIDADMVGKAQVLTYVVTESNFDQSQNVLNTWIQDNSTADVVITTLGLTKDQEKHLRDAYSTRATVVSLKDVTVSKKGFDLDHVLQLAENDAVLNWRSHMHITALIHSNADVKCLLVSNGVPFTVGDLISSAVILILSIGGVFIPVSVNTSAEVFKLAEKAA
jgi:hypothetical protein